MRRSLWARHSRASVFYISGEGFIFANSHWVANFDGSLCLLRDCGKEDARHLEHDATVHEIWSSSSDRSTPSATSLCEA